VIPARILTVLLVTGTFLGCQRAGPVPNLDAGLADCLPPNTVALAGLHLDAIRQTRFYHALPSTWLAMLEPVQQANYLLLASNGKDLLAVARGQFSTAPAGGVLLNPQLALAGSQQAVRAATAQHSQRRTGASVLLADAGAITAMPIWLIALGGQPLPLTGNLNNVTTLLRLTNYVTLSAGFPSGADISLAAACPSDGEAQELEEKIRAIVTLAKAATHDPVQSAMLQSVQLRRNDSAVYVQFSATAAGLEKLLR
jgi:hypothetical protein